MFAGKKSAQIREILISESAWEEMTCLFAPSLRNPRETVSPFLLTDPGEMGKMLADIPFLERLGYELTRPVLPKSAALDYIPSQYICEFIKKTGFHGVLYSSSVSEGINLALFDPLNATGGNVSVYDIDKVEVSVSKQD